MEEKSQARVRIRAAKGGLKAPPEGWSDRIVVLWGEDECTRNDPDSESAGEAWDRILCGPHSNFGSWKHRGEPVATVDHGDWCAVLYGTGYVLITSFEGHEIGILAEVF